MAKKKNPVADFADFLSDYEEQKEKVDKGDDTEARKKRIYEDFVKSKIGTRAEAFFSHESIFVWYVSFAIPCCLFLLYFWYDPTYHSTTSGGFWSLADRRDEGFLRLLPVYLRAILSALLVCLFTAVYWLDRRYMKRRLHLTTDLDTKIAEWEAKKANEPFERDLGRKVRSDWQRDAPKTPDGG